MMNGPSIANSEWRWRRISAAPVFGREYNRVRKRRRPNLEIFTIMNIGERYRSLFEGVRGVRGKKDLFSSLVFTGPDCSFK